MEAKKKESEKKKIPVFTVFKKGLMFKNIFLLDKTTTPLLIHSPNSLDSEDTHNPKDGDGDGGDEEVLLVGRNPDCSIVLEHPSISRFHLRIHLQPSLQKLSVVDLSSAHGTWVSDRKIEPQVRVDLSEGDTLRLGVSTRTYTLHWVSLSSVLNGENPVVSQNLEALVPPPEVKQEEEEVSGSEQQFSPLSHVFDDVNSAEHQSLSCAFNDEISLLLSNSENHLPSQEIEEHLCPSGRVFDVENPSVSPNSETTALAEVKEEGVVDYEYLYSAEQHFSPANPVSGGENSLILSNFDNQLLSEEVEVGSLLKNENPVPSDQHLCPLGRVLDVENPLVLLDSESLVLPEVKEGGGGVFDNEYLNSAEHHLSHVSGDENSPVLSNFENQLAFEEKEEGDVLEKENPISFEQRLYPLGYVFNVETPVDLLNSKTLKPPEVKEEEFVSESAEQHLSTWSHVYDDENMLGLSIFENDFSLEERGEVGVLENNNPLLFEQQLGSPGHVFDNENILVLSNLENDLPPEEIEEVGVLENNNPNLFEQQLGSPGHVFDNENILVMSNLENDLPIEEVGVLENKNPILSEQHLSPPGHVFDAKTQLALQQNLIGALHSENAPIVSPPGEVVEGMLDTQLLISSAGQYLNPLSHVFDVESPIVSPSTENTLLHAEKEVKVVLTNENANTSAWHMSPPSEEILSPSSVCVEVGSESVADYQESPQHRSDKECNTPPSLWSRRGKPQSLIRIATACSNPNKIEDESVTKVLFSSSDAEEESFFSNNENYTPKREVGLESVDKGKSREIELRWSYGSLSSTRSEDKSMSTFSEKENLTPLVSLHDSRLRKPLSESRLGKEADMIMNKRMEGRMPFQCLVVNSVENSKSEARVAGTDTTKSYVNYDQDELTPKVLFACSDGGEEIFTPHKENCSPKAVLGSQSIEKGRSEKSYGSLASSNIEEVIVPKSLGNENSTEVAAVPITTTTCCDEQLLYRNAKKKWYMVVDANCVLNKESRRSLQLLQGLKGTQLIIPRMVIRELDALQRRSSCLLKKTTEASSALQWIEECMVKTKFWIHVQSSGLEEPIAPTPRWLSWLMEEVCSPTAEDRVLDCALRFKRIKKDDGYVVLLSDDVALKIKSMAEGMLCESASEFRESLVNPYSDRFLWVGSIPRGPTWCCLEEPGLREKCYNVPARKIVFKTAEGANKGLKLLLFQDYLNSRQMISVS